ARYCRLAESTSALLVKILTHRSGKIAMTTAMEPTERNASDPAVQATRRARATLPPPIAMPIIGTVAMPNENDSDGSRNSSRAPMPEPASTAAPKPASMWVKIEIVSTDWIGEKQAMAPTFRMSKKIAPWMRRPAILGTTRARPENRYQPITD